MTSNLDQLNGGQLHLEITDTDTGFVLPLPNRTISVQISEVHSGNGSRGLG